MISKIKFKNIIKSTSTIKIHLKVNILKNTKILTLIKIIIRSISTKKTMRKYLITIQHILKRIWKVKLIIINKNSHITQIELKNQRKPSIKVLYRVNSLHKNQSILSNKNKIKLNQILAYYKVEKIIQMTMILNRRVKNQTNKKTIQYRVKIKIHMILMIFQIRLILILKSIIMLWSQKKVSWANSPIIKIFLKAKNPLI